MMLSILNAKLTSLKSNALRVLALGAVAGAVLTAAAPAAQAQRFFVGVRVPAQVYVAPRYVAPVPPVVVYSDPGFVAGYAATRFEPRFDSRFASRADQGFHHDAFRGGRR